VKKALCSIRSDVSGVTSRRWFPTSRQLAVVVAGAAGGTEIASAQHDNRRNCMTSKRRHLRIREGSTAAAASGLQQQIHAIAAAAASRAHQALAKRSV